MTAASAPVQSAAPRGVRATLATCGATHALHDGFGDGMLLFLPLWQAELGLTLAETGALRAMYSIANSALQLPGSFLSERIGERLTLAAGTALLGLGFIAASISGGYVLLAAALLLTGVGASVQHPLSSSLIARSTSGARLRVALGAYNFMGDVGKVAVPALAAFVVSIWGWREATGALGALGVAFALGIFLILPRASAHAAVAPAAEPHGVDGPAKSHWPRFGMLAAISTIDSMGRYGALTLLPFVLIAKGADISTVGVALSLVFAGGATGKFACGLIAIRAGVIGTVIATEIVTAAGILSLSVLPLYAMMPLLPLFGLALNGTSSVLYGSVPETVARDKVGRAFGLFYSMASGGSAIAPYLYGYLGDKLGLETALTILACGVSTILPLAASLHFIKARD